MKTNYMTVKNLGEAILEEKKSKFIAHVCPISDEQQAISFINEMRSKYYDATHNVYAYYIETNEGTAIQRYSDDGEPTGSSGIPTLEAIRKRELQDVVVVVTRYFGGTLLGAAGLIRAYGKAASLGIINANVITRKYIKELILKCDYSFHGKLQGFLHSESYLIKNSEFAQDVITTIMCDIENVDLTIEKLIDFSNATLSISKGESYYIDCEQA